MSIKNMINIIGGTTSKFNLEIPANVTDVELEVKVIGIFSWVHIFLKGADIEDCQRLGNPKNTIVRFVNRKFCYQALDKKNESHKLDSKMMGFNPFKTLYFSKNLTPLNQLLAWKCRELKRASMIQSSWRAWDVIRIMRTAN